MCGRFENVYPMSQIIPFLDPKFVDKMNIEKPSERKIKATNIAPTDKILTINNSEKGLELLDVNWGIKFKPDSPLIFNSRIETVKEKLFWKGLLDKKKLLIPMTGFYEWKVEGKRKQPYKISLKDHELFFVPSLFTVIKGEVHTSLITTEPNKFMKDVHRRMPVIFTKDVAERFFENTVEENIELCKPLSDSVDMEMEAAEI